MIYLDHNATTPTRPEVVEAMVRCCREIGGNPASPHRAGRQARKALEDARDQVAAILGADLAPPCRDRLVFTSGGTEANNLAVLGIAESLLSREDDSSDDLATPRGRIIISSAEHQSVLEPAEHLLEQGWRLDTLGLASDGVVLLEPLRALLAETEKRSPTRCIVSLQLGNHETGVLQPVADAAEMCRSAGIPLHSDAVQVVGKLPVHFRRLGVSAMSAAAHKFQGPAGIGALVVRADTPIAPRMFGGHQQSGLRPGTEPVALAVGMATALDLWQKEHVEHTARLAAIRDRFEAGLRVALPEMIVHGATASRLPQTSSVAFPGCDAQTLLMALDLAGIACSIGSACASGASELSPTLRAMNLSNDLVSSSLRFSFGATNTEAEVDEAVRRIVRACREAC